MCRPRVGEEREPKLADAPQALEWEGVDEIEDQAAAFVRYHDEAVNRVTEHFLVGHARPPRLDWPEDESTTATPVPAGRVHYGKESRPDCAKRSVQSNSEGGPP